MTEPLCAPPPDPQPGACAPPEPPPAAPLPIDNPPGLAAIAYRIGTFGSFRRAMLAAMAGAQPPGGAAGAPARWSEGGAGDYQTALVELWAYLADILTFYQERVANEAYLPTATQRDSLLRIAELIGYRPSPGSGASALLAFTAEPGTSIAVPAGFRVASKPAPGRPPVVFETEGALSAGGAYSAIPLSAVAPTDQLAPLEVYSLIFRRPPAPVRPRPKLPKSRPRPHRPWRPREWLVEHAYARAYGERLGRAYYKTAPRGVPIVSGRPMTVIDEAAEARIASLVNPAPAQVAAAAQVQVAVAGVAAAPAGLARGAAPAGDAGLVLGAARDGEEDGPQETTRPIVVRGADTRLQPGDYVLLVETAPDERGRAQEAAHLRQLAAVRPDRAAGTTTLDWIEEVGTEYQEGAERQLFALRVAAAPFGSSAPSWFGLPPSLTNSDGKNAGAPFDGANWDEPAGDWSFIPTPPTERQEGDPDTAVFLDTLYPEVKGTPDRPGWAVLMTDDPDDTSIFHVVDVRPASKAAYAISGKVTRLVFAEGERLPARTFPLRGTVILTGSEPLELHNLLPLPDPLAGATLILSGLYPELQAGQVAILRGDLYDPARLGPLPSAETVTLAAAPSLDLEHGLTTVALKGALSGSYRRAGAALLANVVAVTQGETVRDEVLGSGDGGAFQSFTLRQKPLTYLPATDAEGLAAVSSTLQVTVNGVRWRERPNLLASPPDGQDYTTATDDAGQTTVVFGDGQSGARPPTGRANIRGRYRKGLGSAGNVGAGGLQQLLDNLPGLQRVTNPLPAFGGTDPEAEDEIRARAPAALRTFGRAISVEDYAALALSYPGVAKASATWAARDPATGRAIAQPYVRLTVATADLVPLARQTVFAARLRAFLDQRRDRNVPLRIVDFVPVFVDVAATVDVDERHPRQATLAAATAALNPGRNPDGSLGLFAFERMGFGQSVALSAVYAALQAVPGVSSATVTALRRPDQDARPTTVRDLILVGPSELAVVKNDLADEANLFGKLTLTLGKGGYLDV